MDRPPGNGPLRCSLRLRARGRTQCGTPKGLVMYPTPLACRTVHQSGQPVPYRGSLCPLGAKAAGLNAARSKGSNAERLTVSAFFCAVAHAGVQADNHNFVEDKVIWFR